MNFRPLEDVSLKKEATKEDGIIIWEKNEVKQLLNAADS